MYIEQALSSLPEILCGSYYADVKYEGGLTNSFSLALLQELNARNREDPLSCIQIERPYAENGFDTDGGKRWLRADLFLSNQRGTKDHSGVANKVLGNHYTWRHHNWLECKFLRGTPQQGTATPQAAADLIRLCTLPQESPGTHSSTGRYFLHVYDAEPQKHYSLKRNHKSASNDAAGSEGSRSARKWIPQLIGAGQSTIHLDDLHLEGTGSFENYVGSGLVGSNAIEIRAEVTNFTIQPREPDQRPPDKTVYWCHLTRIDSFEVKQKGRSFAIDHERQLSEGSGGDFEAIRAEVANALKIPASKKQEGKPQNLPDQVVESADSAR